MIRFGRGELSGFARAFSFPAGRAFLLSSPGVLHLHGKAIRAALPGKGSIEIVFDDGEPSKTFETLRGVLDSAISAGLRRDDFIVAAGGGTVTDLAGFAAAILLRGVAWYAVPTTLLGMADAAIGGKTAVDHPAGKNLIGAFHPPGGVLIDPGFLSTLPPRRYREGIVEIYKTLLVGSGAFARKMAGRLEAIAGSGDADPFLEEAIRVKSAIVERDPFERGERRILNFGHTLGHAIEASGGFSRWSHGEAVAIGAAAALHLSASLAGLSRETATVLSRELVAFAGGAGALPAWSATIREHLSRDKKNTAAGAAGVLLADWGRPLVREVTAAQWKDALEALRKG